MIIPSNIVKHIANALSVKKIAIRSFSSYRAALIKSDMLNLLEDYLNVISALLPTSDRLLEHVV